MRAVHLHDRLAALPAAGWLERWDARARVGALTALALVVASTQTLEGAGAGLGVVAALLLAGGVGANQAAARLRWLALFLVPIALLVPFRDVGAGGPVWSSWSWGPQTGGVHMAALLCLRAAAAGTAALLALGVGHFDRTARSLRALGVPARLVHMTLLTYRYLFVFRERLDRRRAALASRAFVARANRHTANVYGRVTAGLLLEEHRPHRTHRPGHALPRLHRHPPHPHHPAHATQRLGPDSPGGRALHHPGMVRPMDVNGQPSEQDRTSAEHAPTSSLKPQASSLHSLLQVQDLSHRYADGTEGLTGVNLAVAAGERVGLIGPNGAGKSTLLLHLNGVLEPTAGRVLLGGRALADDWLPEVRRRVGLVFQDPDDMLFTARVEDDVAFGPLHLDLGEDEVGRRTVEALSAVGITSLRDRAPHHLSLGEKRAAALACVLAMEPEIFVLDEPSSNLDPRSRRTLLELLERLAPTLLLASHDLELVLSLCQRVVLLDGGRVICDGPTREVLGDEPLMLEHGLERPHSLTPHQSAEHGH